MTIAQKSILLIISGGIAAYKTPDLVRRLRQENISVTCILTGAGAEFVTPLTLGSLSGNPVYTDLLDLKEETEIGHIQLSRQADLVVVAPATANLMAKMAHGLADDLASTCLLATDKPVLVAPAMNVRMWQHPATQRNVRQLMQEGTIFCGPESGEMACGETGLGRMGETNTLARSIREQLDRRSPPALPLLGKSILVTAGPTHEKIDPVRYIANHSSGKQGYAIAATAARMGANVTLVSGPTQLEQPNGVRLARVTTATEMLESVLAALPADIAICAAAVADWRVKNPATQKMKKRDGQTLPQLTFTQNPDILHTLSNLAENRPALVIGFAAETENIIGNAQKKLARKGCDAILANDVSEGNTIFGGDNNKVHYITRDRTESWESMTKQDLSIKLLKEINLYCEINNNAQN